VAVNIALQCLNDSSKTIHNTPLPIRSWCKLSITSQDYVTMEYILSVHWSTIEN
jgi:hypothetical protein